MREALLVCKKEFLELSKDKRTLFLTFFLPLLLYPVIFFMIASLGRRDSAHRLGKPSRILLVDSQAMLAPRLHKAADLFEVVALSRTAAREALLAREVELVVEVDPAAREKLERQEPLSVRIQFDETEPSSVLAKTRVDEAIRAFDAEQVGERLARLHASPRLTQPTRLIPENVADAGLEMGKLLGSFLPYVLMLMMFQGAMQHGIHTTAGEKERGTLQSLLATPLRRSQIIWGKLLYIFAMGLIAAVLNLLSMGISLALVLGSAASVAARASGLPQGLDAMTSPVVLSLSFLLMLPLGLLFSAFILFMGIRARNTAEAGTSLMPALFLIVTLGAFSLAPGLERMALLPYMPILNVSLAIRKLFSQQGNGFEFVIAFIMTAGLAAAVTWAATRVLERESVLFRQG